MSSPRPSTSLGKWRVKLYSLEEAVTGGSWHDRGTGYASVERGILIVREEISPTSSETEPENLLKESQEEETLLSSRIRMEDVYERQGESIIMWRETNNNTDNSSVNDDNVNEDIDYALSFQDSGGCTYVWETIARAQDRYLGQSSGSSPKYLSNYEECNNKSMQSSSSCVFSAVNLLPEMSLENLGDIRDAVVYSLAYGSGSSIKEGYTRIIVQQDLLYLRQLLCLLPQTESLEQKKLLATILRCMLQYNSSAMYSFVTHDADTLAEVAAVLEYDYDSSLSGSYRRTRPALRDFIVNHTNKLVQVVPMSSNLLSMVHLQYRLMFLRDTLLGEEVGFSLSNLSSLLSTVSMDICTHLIDEQTHLVAVVEVVASQSLVALRFLREFLTMCMRYLHAERRTEMLLRLFQRLGDSFFGALNNILCRIICDCNASSQRLCEDDGDDIAAMLTDVLMLIVQMCPSALIHHILSAPHPAATETLAQTSFEEGVSVPPNMFLSMIKLITLPLEEVSELMCEAVRVLVDPGVAGVGVEKDRFMGALYDHYIRFCVPATTQSASTVRSLCGLLSACVIGHSYRMKYFVMRNNVIAKVTECLSHRSRVVAIDIIRFLRVVVALKDDFYHRHMVKADLLRPLLQSLNCRDNLATSLVLDLLEFIRIEGITVLIEYIVEKYASSFDLLMHSDSFDKLRLKYEQLKEPSLVTDVEVGPQPLKEKGALTSEEDAYFEADGDEESAENFPSGLLAISQTYSDDTDEEDSVLDAASSSSSLSKRKREDLTEPAHAFEDDSRPPLPPLRPKFDAGDDEPAMFSTFLAASSTAAVKKISFSLSTKQNVD